MNPPHTDYFQTIFQCPLCNSVPVEERDNFLRDVRYSIKRYGKGDMLVAQGSVYEMLYIVVKGEVVTEMSDEKGEFVKMELIRAPQSPGNRFFVCYRQRFTGYRTGENRLRGDPYPQRQCVSSDEQIP